MNFDYIKKKIGVPLMKVGSLIYRTGTVGGVIGFEAKDLFTINLLTFISFSLNWLLYGMIGTGLIILILLIRTYLKDTEKGENYTSHRFKKLILIWNIFLFFAVLLSFMYMQLKDIDYSSNGYANVIHSGDIFKAEEFFAGFNSPKDFTATIQLEDSGKYPQSVLIYALEKQTPNYQKIFALAKQYGFTVNEKILYNYYKDNNKLQAGKYIGKIFWIISEDYLAIKYNAEYTISQYLLGLSHADFTPDYLAYLQQIGINFEEGIAFRKGLIDFVRSDECKNKLYDLEDNKNFQEVYKRFIDEQEKVLKTLQNFYSK